MRQVSLPHFFNNIREIIMSLQEAEYGLTESAMGHSGQNAGDEALLVKFYLHPRQNAEKTLTEGRPIFDDREYVSIMVPGNKSSVVERPATAMDKQRFPTHYKAFTNRIEGDGDVLQGTPLAEWSGLTRGQVEELRFFNVRTVEQLSTLSDSNSQKFLGVGTLRKKAKAYLEMSEGNAGAERLRSMEDENELLKEQMALMVSKMEALESAGTKKSAKK